MSTTLPEASWLLFTVASLVLIATRGQDMILDMSRSVTKRPSAGVAAAAGVSLVILGNIFMWLWLPSLR